MSLIATDTNVSAARKGVGITGFAGEHVKKEDYNEINLLETDDAKIAKLEMWIAKEVGTAVMNRYPNRQWGVRANAVTGEMWLTCNSVSITHGYRIFLAGKNIYDLQQRAIHAAGEILERYNLTRARKFNPEILETLPRDIKGDAIAADAAAERV